MPPKPAPGKKGADEIDMTDLASLPHLNFITFTVLYNRFFSHASREKLQKYVNEHYSQERVRVLTREEIITYGKGKQIILEHGQAATLPQDDPRAKMSEADQIAKAAYERLFELQVIARRTKKERLQKIEEEAKASQQPLQIDTDLLDVIFQITDFPNTKEEAAAFAKMNATLNCVFEVNQVSKVPIIDDDEDLLEQLQGQEQPLGTDADGNDKANEDKTHHRLEQLFNARSASQKNSSLRHLAVIKLDYTNWPYHDFKVNDLGEEVEVKKDAEVAFSDDLNGKLEHFGALYVKFQRFREKVQLMPLSPDPSVLTKLHELVGQSEEYKQWLSNVENLIASIDQQAQTDPTQSEQYHTQKKELEEVRASKSADEENRKKVIHDCKDRLKDSQDDRFYMDKYQIDTYDSSFLSHKEGQNSISAIMSAMVSQIASENSYSDVYEQNVKQSSDNDKSNSTADDTIDDLFESFNAEVNYDLQIWERPDYTDTVKDNDISLALAPAIRDRKYGCHAQLIEQTETGEINEYNNELDTVKRPVQKLSKVASESDETTAEDISVRSRSALQNLVLPGISQRNLMPPVSQKSKRLRDFERPSLYPFATLPVEDVERGLIMKAFQELIRSNQIDEGASSDKTRHQKYKVFERSFEEHLSPSVLRQVLAEAMINDPDVASLYYPRDDSLLVALYNKVNSDTSKLDGSRDWRAAYRVMPDFENWLKYFAEDIVVEAEGSKKVEGHPLKYQMDEEMIPDQLLDIDDIKVSSIAEKSDLLYPADGSVMKVDHCSVGGIDFKKSVITKDNLIFGLRRATDREYQGSANHAEEYGLVSYKKIGTTDFWLRFENDTKVLIESVQKVRNPQKLIRIDPPKPTPEEIAAREEAVKQAQALAAKNKGKPGTIAPVIEEYKEPEPTWEPEAFDFLDTLFNDDDLDQNTYNQVTTTLANGLIVQHLSDGNIIQITQDQLLKGESDERDRVFLFYSKGVVIRHLRNRDAEVLFPSGVIAKFTKKDMTWVVTNNKGLRRAKKAGVVWDLEPIPCAYETDSVTNARIMIREDKVMTIEYPDGTFFCQHADGTLMKSFDHGANTRIEKEGYAPVIFKRPIATKDGSYYHGRQQIQTVQALTVERRTQNDQIIETHLPDNTVIDTYLDLTLFPTYQAGIQHIFNRHDLSILAVNQCNKIKVISSNARSALNEAGEKRPFGKDVDYLFAITSDFEEACKGVYNGHIGNPTTDIHINDCDKNTKYLLSQDLNLSKNQINDQLALPATNRTFAPSVGQDIFENINQNRDPFTKHFITPRLFVIRNDGSGYELFTKQQLDYYFRVQKIVKETMKERKDMIIGKSQCKAHYFLSKIITLADKEEQNSHLKFLEFPQNALYALLHLKEKTGDQPLLQAQPDQYVFRQFFEFQPFELLKQQLFNDDYERFKKWKINQVRYDNEFGVTFAPAKDGTLDIKKIEQEEAISRKINMRVMRERKNMAEPFNGSAYEMQFLQGIQQDEEVQQYQNRLTSVHQSDEEMSPKVGGETTGRSIRRMTTNAVVERPSAAQKLRDSQNEKIRNLKRKQKAQIENQLQDIRRMVNTPVFVSNYYDTKNGQSFQKVNPTKAPSQEVLMRISQRVDRSQQQNEKGGASYQDGHSARSHRDQHNSSPLGHTGGEEGKDDQEDKESPIVALEPEEPGLKQGSAFLGGSKKVTNPDGTVTQEDQPPSYYLQEKIYIKQKEQETLLKAEEYHVIKTKDFNVVGRLRQDKPVVKVMQKSTAQSELNEKFITTECIADRRVKISSLAPRQYINAPSVEDVRKQGQHQMILSAINKKQTFAELINQANAMVTSVLHDPLKRSFNVMPSSLKFGYLKVEQTYELIITLKNEDSVAQRINLKPLSDPRITAKQAEMGLVAPGMIRKVSVSILSSELGVIKDTLQIITKSDVFKIPIEATILSSDDYEREISEQRALNPSKNVTNSRVREKLNESIQKGRQAVRNDPKKSSKQILEGEEGEEAYLGEGSPNGGMYDGAQDQWVDTTNSESKLPQLPQGDKRPFDVDPKKGLKDVLKK